MNCSKIQMLLPDFQDGTLSVFETSEIKSHLSGCVSCRRENELFLKSWSLLSELKPIQPSTNFKSRFWQRVQAKESRVQAGGWRKWLEAIDLELAISKPAFVLSSFVFATILGIILALKILPLNSIPIKNSPVLEWAKSNNQTIKIGGLSL